MILATILAIAMPAAGEQAARLDQQRAREAVRARRDAPVDPTATEREITVRDLATRDVTPGRDAFRASRDGIGARARWPGALAGDR